MKNVFKIISKKILSVFLALVLCLSMIPALVFNVSADSGRNTVTRNGGLNAQVSYTRYVDNENSAEEKAVFDNRLLPESVTATISGVKKYNKALLGGEFTFTEDQSQSVITYNATGTYYYVIKESIPEEAVNGVYNNVKYDTSEYTVTVEVKEEIKDGRTVLVTNVSYSDDVVFENTYIEEKSEDKEPEEPEKQSPQTSDYMNIGFTLTIGITSLIICLVLIFFKRKRRA